jgi:hypothetical protein
MPAKQLPAATMNLALDLTSRLRIPRASPFFRVRSEVSIYIVNYALHNLYFFGSHKLHASDQVSQKENLGAETVLSHHDESRTKT